MSELPPVPLALADLIGRRALALSTVFGDPELRRRDFGAAAQQLAGKLLAGDRGAGGVALELAWPDSEPPAGWWSSPLGAATALAIAEDDRMDVERAAAVLGVTAAAIEGDLATGLLDRHPDGGATLASVRTRFLEERSDAL